MGVYAWCAAALLERGCSGWLLCIVGRELGNLSSRRPDRSLSSEACALETRKRTRAARQYLFLLPRADSSSEDTSWKFFARDGDEEVAVRSWGSTTERCQCSFEPADTQFVISHSYATAPLACVGNDVSRG